MVVGSFADVCVRDVGSSVAFYRSLLQLEVLVDHGWYAELGVGAATLIAFVQSGRETVPAITATPPRGVLVSFEVDSADSVYANVAAVRCPVLVDLVTELGQRHFMVADPDGAVIDVIERVELAGGDVSLSIGELAQRLRITTRAARHYDQLGLLVPDSIDSRTGYRSYGEAQLVRGMQIEQLKATGLPLDKIKCVLDIDGAAEGLLRERRGQIEDRLADHIAQLGAIDALLAGRGELAVPELVVLPSQHVVVAHATATHEELSRTIRRTIQRQGRSVRQQGGVRCRSFSARFPLEVDDTAIRVQIAGHLDERATASVIQPAETQLKVELVGNVGLLPIAYDVVLTAVRERGLKPIGTAVEHYLDLDNVGRTEVAIPIQGSH